MTTTSTARSSARTAPRKERGARADDILDVTLIRRRRQNLGLAQQDLARAAGLSLTALTRIENGQPAGTITLNQLNRLAGTLDLDPRELLTGPRRATDGGQPDAVGSDATRLTLLLLVAGDTISRDLAARALGWPLARLVTALHDVEEHADTLGVTVTRKGYSVKVSRTSDPEGRRRLAILQRADATARAVKARTARLIRALATGDPDWGTAEPDIRTEARASGLITTRRPDPGQHSATGHLALTEHVRTAIAPPRQP